VCPRPNPRINTVNFRISKDQAHLTLKKWGADGRGVLRSFENLFIYLLHMLCLLHAKARHCEHV